MEFPFRPHSRFIGVQHRRLASWLFHRPRGRFNFRYEVLSGFDQRPFRNPMMEQVFKNLGRAIDRHKMLRLKINRPSFYARAVVHRTRHPVGK